MVASLSVLNTNSTDQYDCAEAIYASNMTMGAFDPVAGNCFAANATAPILSSITDVDGASVFVIETCATNQASVPTDQGNTCYDLTLDDQSCQVNGQPCS
ncbi:BQ2448_5079 [Microbotryum intermedium]|uniref:BQ2448_5075 protein n=1 Tax=Microbotryum intermedium TaxID=269621 RepID=A0A238F8H8_9BASI|nr:BQ2448_5075 [Microbotryum intermedium]SCV67468.1 BQ2448_5079 [Microbotryum intermedium]